MNMGILTAWYWHKVYIKYTKVERDTQILLVIMMIIECSIVCGFAQWTLSYMGDSVEKCL